MIDLINREELKKVIDKEFEKAYLSDYEACSCVCEIYDKCIDNAPTIETDIEVVAKDAYDQGYTDGWKERFGEPDEIQTGELADEVWKLYEKHHSHLATYVYEFGEELKELLSKYQKGGAEMKSGDVDD